MPKLQRPVCSTVILPMLLLTRTRASLPLGMVMSTFPTPPSMLAVTIPLAGKYLVFVALGSGVIAFLVWYFTGAGVVFALSAAVSAIVIACPDALALATPTAIIVGVAKGA
ncbi:P-type ATPase [Deinococcus sp. UYEF24]